MKSLFLPKCALPRCILMWSNPISEFSTGPVTKFSGLAPGCWLGLGEAAVISTGLSISPLSLEHKEMKGKGQRPEARETQKALETWLLAPKAHVNPLWVPTVEFQPV